jgi:uncharacterized protein YwqG
MIEAKARVIELCRGRAAQGMPAAMVEAIIGLLWPSIRLIPEAAQDTNLGRSRIGGLPDLPEGHDWPAYEKLPEHLPTWAPATWDVLLGQPLSFLLQVNLAEVAPFDVEGRLPNAGMLYFFYLDVGDRFGLSPRPDEIIHVLYVPTNEGTFRRVASPAKLPPKEVYRGYTLSPRLEWVIPEPFDLVVEGIALPDIEAKLEHWSDRIHRSSLQEEAAVAQGFGPWCEPKYRLLGHPQLIQACRTANGYPGARLLLQVDSDSVREDADYPRTGMMWGDAGRIYYYIRQDDLAAHNFGAVWAHHEMS